MYILQKWLRIIKYIMNKEIQKRNAMEYVLI